MQRIRPDVDIVMDVLKAVLDARPADAFVQSLLQQYQERGGLSKKQLEGLHGKASRLDTVSAAKLATLEAIILRKHSKQRSELPENRPLYTADDEAEEMIRSILEKFPEHKRVLFLQSKCSNHEPLSVAEKGELLKFFRLLNK